jgi:single-strand DNA-binding protein
MSERTIVGNLAENPVTEQAGRATVVKFAVIEDTGRYRKGDFVKDDTATRHNVEAWFDLGENVAATLTSGQEVIVVGDERTESWGEEGARQYRRILRAKHIGPNLRFQVAQVRKVERQDNGE